MSQDTSWMSADLELLPDDGKRYEIIDGELHVSKQAGWHTNSSVGRSLLSFRGGAMRRSRDKLISRRV